MNEFIGDILSLRYYIEQLQIILNRYVSKSVGLKIALSLLFVLCLIFWIGMLPIVLIGLLVKLLFDVLINDILDKGGFFVLIAYVAFMEFFILMYVCFALELLFYGIIKLLALGLGKTINERPVEKIYKLNTDKPQEEKQEDIYVINDDNFK